MFTKWNNAISSVTEYPGAVHKRCHTLDQAAEMFDLPPDTPMNTSLRGKLYTEGI